MSGVVSRSISIYIDQASAERSLKQLQETADNLRKTIKKGEDAGKSMRKEWEKLADTNKNLQRTKDILDGKIAPSINQVKAKVKELVRELHKMSESDAGFEAKRQQWQQATKDLDAMKKKAFEVAKAVDDVDNSGGKKEGFFSKWGGQIKAVALGTIVGNTVQAAADSIIGYVSGMVSGNAKLSDSFAGVAQTTGMSVEQVKALNKELKGINTRTAGAELLKIAEIGGQFNVASGEMKDFVEEVNKVNVVLGGEFGGGAEEITREMSLLRNVFSDIKSDKISDDIAHISNAVIVLAQEGAATGPVMTDMAKRLSPLISTAKLTSGEILGISAAMEEVAINPERGATAMIRLFDEMTSNIGAFAKVARMGTNEFRQLLKVDSFGAFQKVLQGFKEGGKDVLELNGVLEDLEVSGIGAKEVLVKLSENTENLANRADMATEALTKTDAITEQYNKRNDNFAGNLEKIGKAMMSAVVNSKFMEGIGNLVAGFGKLIGAIDSSSEALDEFNLSKAEFTKLSETINPLINDYENLQQKAKELGGVSRLSADDQHLLKDAIKAIADSIPSAIVEFDKYGQAIDINIGKAKEFIKYQKLGLQEKNRKAVDESAATVDELNTSLKNKKEWLASYDKLQKGEIEAYKEKIKYSRFLSQKEKEQMVIAKTISINESYNKSVAKVQKDIGELNNRIIGQYQIQSELTGKRMDEIIPRTESVTDFVYGLGMGAVESLGSTAVDTSKTVGEAGKEIIEDVSNVASMTGAAIRKELKELKKEASKDPAKKARIIELDKELKSRVSTAPGRNGVHAKEQAEATMKSIRLALENLGAETEAILKDLEKGAGNKHEQQIAAVTKQYGQLHTKLTNLNPKLVETATTMAACTEAEKNHLAALAKKHELERNEEEYSTSLQNLSDYYEQKRQVVMQAHVSGQTDAKAYKAALKQLEVNEAQDKVTIMQDYAPKVKKAAEDLEAGKTEALKKGIGERALASETELNDGIYRAERAVLIARKGSQQETDAKIALLRERFKKETAELDVHAAEYLAKEAQLENDIQAIKVDSWQKKMQMVIGGLQIMQGAMQSYFDMLNSKENEALNKDKAINEKKKAQYKKQLDDKIISQEQYNRKVEQLDEAYRKKENAAKKKQFQRNKAAAYAEAVINAAQGVTAIWAQYAAYPYVAAALTAISAVSTGMKIATISRQKFSEYAKGGKAPQAGKGGLPDGDSHASGGIGMYDKWGNKIGEMEGGEPIISKNAYANNKAAVDALLYSSMYQGGKQVDLSHLYASPRGLSYERGTEYMHGARMYKNGGFGGNGSLGISQTDPKLLELMDKIHKTLDGGIVAHTDLVQHNRKQTELDLIRKQGSFVG